ncbi:0309963f-dce6-49f0-88c1-ae2e8a797d1f [Sclerotinia trifoliorum]|uniref:0309963f-dce6-49f0-88c1-ae2e8a797d1f n=1 Tax=Sclerotinia trifoliorum TaxID=28548 RepID=A0A8H2ZPL4_9HELO|nr:0309963f-dce6-49f0-88c1-ae2e8a797d1f [Sclerotinia trifoliorum]
MFRTFILFNSLPKELQLTIWKLALQDVGPRTVKLRLCWWEYKVPTTGCRDYLGSILTARQKYKAKIPSLLHTCQDSREVALKVYKLSFAKLLQDRPVYFDIEKDTLWVSGGCRQNFRFPVRLIGMDGFRNLIITPSSRGFIGHNSAITSFEPLSTWLNEFLLGTKGPKKHVQIVHQEDRMFSTVDDTDAQLLYNGFMRVFNKQQIHSEIDHRYYPSITVVRRDNLDFGGGHW